MPEGGQDEEEKNEQMLDSASPRGNLDYNQSKKDVRRHYQTVSGN